MTEEQVKELITRRRRQVLVHSHIYYRLNDSIISDSLFDKWAKELAELQETHPEISKTCKYAKEFEDFDGSTGFHLKTDKMHELALSLIKYHEEEDDDDGIMPKI